MRWRAIERLRIACAFLAISAILAGPVFALTSCEALGYSWGLNFAVGIAMGLMGLAGFLLLALPAYLLLLPARWFARSNRMPSIWLAAILFSVSLGTFVAFTRLLVFLMDKDTEPSVGLVFFIPWLLGTASIGLLTQGLFRILCRKFSVGLLIILVCCALVTAELSLLGLTAATLAIAEYYVRITPYWFDAASGYVAGGIGLLPPFLLAGSIMAYVGANRIITQIVREGECPECGYDLRGQESPGCPECGWGRRGEEGSGEREAL